MLAVLDSITELPQSDILLFIVLILLFVVGYKILQAVIQLGVIAILSGVFLVALRFVGIGPAVTVDNIILFMVLGTGLFILYTTLFTAMKATDTLFGMLTHIGRQLLSPIGDAIRNHRSTTSSKTGKQVKEKEKSIILDEVDEEDDEA